MTKVGQYARNGAIIGAVAGIPLAGFNPFLIIPSAIIWGAVGCAVGAGIGAIAKDNGNYGIASETRGASPSGTQARTQGMAQEMYSGQQQPSTYYQDKIAAETAPTDVPQR